MRKIMLLMSTSLDGFIAGLDKEDDTDEPSSEEHAFANEQFAAADTVLFGRTTYEGFIGYWDTLDLSDASVPALEIEFARIFRSLKRVVFSRTLAHVAHNALLIRETIAENVQQLKQEPGKNLLLVCGPELFVALVETGLVDELKLLISPKALGRGKSLFEHLTHPMKLTLLNTREFESGTVLHHYQINYRSPEK